MEEIYQILYGLKPGVDFRSSRNLVDEGLLDSLEILELIDELSDKYGIIIGADDIDPDNFTSVEKIWEMVKKYRTIIRKE